LNISCICFFQFLVSKGAALKILSKCLSSPTLLHYHTWLLKLSYERSYVYGLRFRVYGLILFNIKMCNIIRNYFHVESALLPLLPLIPYNLLTSLKQPVSSRHRQKQLSVLLPRHKTHWLLKRILTTNLKKSLLPSEPIRLCRNG